MKFKILILLSIIGFYQVQAQTRTTKETKVVLVVNKKTNEITNMELFDVKNAEMVLPKKYPNSKFYIGVLKGNFELNKDVIEPKSGALITMYTDKQLFSSDKFIKSENITIGKVKTQIISSKKGELILKTLDP